MGSIRTPAIVRAAFALTALWLVVFTGDNLLHGTASRSGTYLFDLSDEAFTLLPALLVLWRVLSVPGERPAWTLIALGMIGWWGGDMLWNLDYADSELVPVPNATDAGYLMFPLLVAPGAWLLWRERTGRVTRSLAVDGLAAGLTVAALSAVLSFEAVLATVGGRTLEIATLLAYPLSDLLLLMALVGALASRGWILDRTFVGLGAAVLAFWLADTMYLVEIANGTYVLGTWFDPLWYWAFALIGWAAWQPARRVEADPVAARAVVMPVLFALGALVLLTVGHFGGLNSLAFGLAVAALVAVNARLVLAFAQNATMLDRTRHEALTDALTGLGNRRALVRTLEAAVDTATPDSPVTLALYDLDGFKHYNDTFGHPAGDALLQRLGDALAACVDGRAQAFRMGGDEFCVLFHGSQEEGVALAAGAAAALTERGDGFVIGCSHGLALLPRDAADPDEALRLADHELYAVKTGRRSAVDRQTKDALRRVLQERSPDVASHCDAVAEAAEAVAERLGIPTPERETLRHAAELHDIGKIAVPDPILLKRGPLDAHEWEYIRKHPTIGERITGAAPSLMPVAKLIRSTHERWDGGGYPDGLAGREIPLGARVIAVCDAYDAMVSDRPYARTRTHEEALAELRRCAGSQFDPAAVRAFCEHMDEKAARATQVVPSLSR